MDMKTYDLIIIGGGSAGSTAAKTAVRADKQVAMVERDKLGGTCLNYGCDPTKALLHIAGQRHFLLSQNPAVNPDLQEGLGWSDALERVQGLINAFRGGSHEDAIARQKKRGVDFYSGTGRFLDAHTLEVAEEKLWGDQFIIATGMQAVAPPIQGLEQSGFITNREAVSLKTLPDSLAIIGAGFVGIEFAQMFQRFGVQVSVFDQVGAIVPNADGALSGEIQALLEEEGVCFELNAEILSVQKVGQGKKVAWSQKGDVVSAVFDEVLVAAGRVPAVEGLCLEKAGVEMCKGGVRVNSNLRTTCEHIWAAGDVTGYPPFTHVAAPQGKLAAANAFCQVPETFDAKAIPSCLFTDPPLAQVGETEESLEKDRVSYHQHVFEIAHIPRQVIEGDGRGKIKMLADDSGRILGAHVLSFGADDLIATLALAMRCDISVDQVADAIFPYPTRSQALAVLANRFTDSLEDRCPNFLLDD